MIITMNATTLTTCSGPTRTASARMDHRRLTQTKKEYLRSTINQMKDNIIEECESPWTAPVVLVPKMKDEWRLCVDYRQLNAVTKPDRYPLPRIDDLLHGAKGTTHMSTLDLQSGYWQVPVAREDAVRTTKRSRYLPNVNRQSESYVGRSISRGLLRRHHHLVNELRILSTRHHDCHGSVTMMQTSNQPKKESLLL